MARMPSKRWVEEVEKMPLKRLLCFFGKHEWIPVVFYAMDGSEGNFRRCCARCQKTVAVQVRWI